MKRVLLVRLSAMGDLCQSLGAMQALQEQCPDLELHVVTQTSNQALLDGLGFTSVIPFDRHGGWRGLRDVRQAMRRVDADVAVDLQGNWKSALITRMSGAGRRVGAAAGHRQAPASGWLLERLGIEGPKHPAHVAAGLLSEISGQAASPTTWGRRASLRATELELARVDGQLIGLGLDPQRPIDVLVVARPDDNRAWPIPAMQRQASATSAQVLWLRGPAESAVELPPGVLALTHEPGSLRDLVALGCRIAGRQGRVFGPDVGGTHVLAACGAQTHALFGPQDPERTGPPGAHILVHPNPPNCMPCRSRGCAHPKGPVCMEFDAVGADQGS